MSAFWELITERGAGPVIPHSKIEKYGERKYLDSTMNKVLVFVIRSLEQAHSSWQERKQELAEMANKPSPAKRAKGSRG